MKELGVCLRVRQSKMKKIKISVCMITYNHEYYVVDAIKSILSQKGDFDLEIVIGDDCSTDNTPDILLEFQKQYPAIIKLNLRTKNVGVNKNFAETLFSCTGKYIAILEGDDYWIDECKLQKQLNFLETNSNYVLVYSGAIAFNENGIIGKAMGIEYDVESIELMKSPPINTLTTFFRNVLKEFPQEFYSVKFCDLFLWSLLGHYGCGKYLESVEDSMYRVHNDGIFSKKLKSEKYEMALLSDVLMFGYYDKTNQKDIKTYYKNKILEDWINSESTGRVLLFLLKKRFDKIKNSIKKRIKLYSSI